MRNAKWNKIIFLILFSLEIIVLAFLGMYVAWKLTIPLNGLIKAIATIFGGIVSFALGSMIFWRFSTIFSKGRRASNCSRSQS